MAEHLFTLLVIEGLLTALFAGALVLLAARSWLRTRDTRMLRLAAGFGLLLVAVGIEALSYNVLFPGDLVTAHVIEGFAMLVGFGILIWALF